MKNLFYACLFFTFTLFVVSCENNSDTTPPEIEVITPSANDTIMLGDNLNLKLRLKDEYGVRYYSYDFFYEFPGTLGEFEKFNEYNLAGAFTELEDSHSFKIPTHINDTIPTVTGNYNLRIIAIDWYNNRNVVDLPIKVLSNSEE